LTFDLYLIHGVGQLLCPIGFQQLLPQFVDFLLDAAGDVSAGVYLCLNDGFESLFVNFFQEQVDILEAKELLVHEISKILELHQVAKAMLLAILELPSIDGEVVLVDDDARTCEFKFFIDCHNLAKD
jgi:hypothetical protein